MTKFMKDMEARATPNPANKFFLTEEDGVEEDTEKEPVKIYDDE